MIPQEYRLRLNSRHQFVGKKQAENAVIIISTPAPSPRWAIRVSKKIDHRAVVRNKLRRQINFWLLNQVSNLPQNDFLVIVRKKPPTPEALFDLYKDISHALHLI